MVTWLLNSTRVLPQDPGREVNERSSQNGPYNVTTSMLMISSAQQKLNVEVQCLARSTNAEIDLPDANATAKLVVLGKLFISILLACKNRCHTCAWGEDSIIHNEEFRGACTLHLAPQILL